MIKTIIQSSIEEIDKKTNSFIKNKKILGIIPSQMYEHSQTYHKITICFEEEKEEEKEQPKSKIKIGALWRNEYGTIKGKINDENIKADKHLNEKFQQDTFEIEIKGIKCIIEKNQNKTNPKQPDWIIYQINTNEKTGSTSLKKI